MKNQTAIQMFDQMRQSGSHVKMTSITRVESEEVVFMAIYVSGAANCAAIRDAIESVPNITVSEEDDGSIWRKPTDAERRRLEAEEAARRG